MSWTFLRNQWADLLQNHPGIQNKALPPSPRGGLGLFVLNGDASFQNVEVQPLPASP